MSDSRPREPGLLQLLLVTVRLAGVSGLTLLAVTAAMSLVTGVTEPAVAWLIKAVIDGAAQGSPGSRWPLGTLAVLIAFAMGVGAVLPRFNDYLSRALSRRMSRRVHEQLFSALSRQHGLTLLERPSFHDSVRMGYGAGITAPHTVIGSSFSLLTGVSTILGFLGTLLAIASPLVLLAVASAVPSIASQFLLSRSYVGATLRMTPHQRRQNFFAELLTDLRAAKEIRLFGLARFFLARMLAELDRTHTHERRVDRLTLGTGAGSGFVAAALCGIAVIYAVELVQAGQVSVGSLAVLLVAFNAVQVGLSGLVDQIGSVQRTLVLMRHYHRVISQPSDLAPPPGGTYKEVPPLRHGIELRDVWFRYDDDHPWVLRSVTAFLPAGQATALVGLNGAGKSTLVKLLCRLYDPQRGAILWDGIDIREMDPAQLRQRMSTVFQDFMAYELTAAENIALGDVDATSRDKVVQAATKVGMHDTLAALPNGYDTLLSRTFASDMEQSAGVLLSGGQWQRLAIARALFRSGADLLILDEPSAALDAATEHELHELLREERRGRTSLLISHRLSTVRGADNIIVLADGQIHEQGTHDELMAADGGYAHLFRLQAEGYQLSASATDR